MTIGTYRHCYYRIDVNVVVSCTENIKIHPIVYLFLFGMKLEDLEYDESLPGSN